MRFFYMEVFNCPHPTSRKEKNKTTPSFLKLKYIVFFTIIPDAEQEKGKGEKKGEIGKTNKERREKQRDKKGG